MPDIVDKLIEKLNSSESQMIRASIVEDLANTRDSRALTPLVIALNDPDTMVRWSAIKGIARFGDEAQRRLFEALCSPDRFTRRNVVQALGEIYSDDVVEKFIRMLMFDEKDPLVQIEIINCLGRMRESRAVDPLTTLLKAGNWEMRWRTINALGRISESKAIQPLLELLEDSDPDIRWAAVIAIENIKKMNDHDEDADSDESAAAGAAPTSIGMGPGKRDFSSVNLVTSEDDKTVTVSVDGELLSGNVDMFSGYVDGVMAGRDGKNLTIDLSKCVFVDSFALGRLNQMRKKMKSARRKFVLTGLKPGVRKVFEITRLNEVFDII